MTRATNHISKTIFAVVMLSTLLMMAAGCGSSGGVPYTSQLGNLEGYVYQKAYNQGSLGRIAMRVAGRETPAGYAPVEGATVSIASTDKSVVTGADGRFYFSELAARTYTVNITKGGSTASFDVAVAQGATTVANDSAGDAELLLTPAQVGVLSVTATSNCAIAAPVVANVFLKSATQSAYFDTGMDTPLALMADIAPGTYSVQVTATGYTTAAQNVTITSGQRSSLTFSLNISDGNAAPFAEISTPAGVNGAEPTFTDAQTVAFTGAGIDCEDGALTGTKLVWTSSLDGAMGTGANLATSSLSVGRHKITLTATDSGGKTSSASIFVVIESAPANTAPIPLILSPQNNATFGKGSVVTFAGAASDNEDGAVTAAGLVWTSSINGNIGTGVAFQTSALSSGKHTITLTATDSGGISAHTSISITVSTTPSKTAPVAVIATPAANATFNLGAMITFTGAANDAEDGALTGTSLAWTSSKDGALGTGPLLQLDSLTPGNHTITLTATDSDGMTGTDTVAIVVSETPGTNSKPTAAIGLPADGASYASGAIIFFAGAATDPEEITITGANLVWTSSIDGQIGTGGGFITSSLSIGTHTIMLTATDSEGAKGRDTITLTIR